MTTISYSQYKNLESLIKSTSKNPASDFGDIIDMALQHGDDIEKAICDYCNDNQIESEDLND